MHTLGQPQYTVRYSYSYHGGARQIRAAVYLSSWGLLYMAHRSTAKQAYQAAQRAIRSYARHGDCAYWKGQ